MSKSDIYSESKPELVPDDQIIAYVAREGAQDFPDDELVFQSFGVTGEFALHKPAGIPKTQDSREALAFARKQTRERKVDWTRWCLRFVRMSWGLPMKYATAREAWEKANRKHKWTGKENVIPHGAPVFSRSRNAGPNDAWHVFLAGGYYRNTRIYRSTDIKEPGCVDACSIKAFSDRWNHEILGWSEDLNGFKLNLPAAPLKRK